MLRGRRFFFYSTTALGLAIAAIVLAHGNEERVATVGIGGGEVTVEYAAPTLKGRDVMKMIQPGSHWRMGADKPTTLTTDVDLVFGGKKVPKGNYVLFAHFLEGGNWSLVVAEGASRGQPRGVVAEVEGTVDALESSVEQMTIGLKAEGSRGSFVLDWGTHRFIAEFSAG